MTSSRTYGLNAVKVAVSPPRRYFRLFAADVPSRRRCGYTSAPVPQCVDRVVRGMAGGGPKQGGCYGT